MQHAEQFANVLEVQAGRRLVEHVDGPSRRSLLQFGGELDPLSLATGQGRCGLAHAHVAEAYVDECLKVARDRRNRGEELERLLDRHVEDLGDRLALVVNLERLPVVTSPVALLARDVDVREEVHLNTQGAITGTRLAPTTLDVEREASLEVAAHLCLGRLGEELANVVEDARIGCRVAPWRAADGALVDVHDLVDQIEARDALVPTRDDAGAVEFAGQGGVEHVIHQRGLA